MQGQLWVGLVGKIIVVRARGLSSVESVHERHARILQLAEENGVKNVMFDFLEAEAPTFEVRSAQQKLNVELKTLGFRVAVVVPDSRLAYFGRIAFGDDNHRIVYENNPSSLDAEGETRISETIYIDERVMKTKTVQAALFFATLVAASTLPAFAQQSTAPGLQDKVKGLFSSTNEDELLEPDAAFKFQVAAKGANTLAADLIPAKGYYLYKQRIQFVLKNASGVSISAVKLPAGEMKTDQIFGRTEVYKKAVPVELTLNGTTKGKSVTLVASYQGCHEKLGVCYPPIEKSVNLVLP